MIEKLMEYNLPFSMRDSLPNLYEHWISKNILAYIQAAHGDLSRGNILQIINRPNRYISRDALGDGKISWDAHQVLLPGPELDGGAGGAVRI